MAPKINYDICSFCGECVDICPLDVLVMTEEGPLVNYPKECWHCGSCRINCPNEAIRMVLPLEMLI